MKKYIVYDTLTNTYTLEKNSKKFAKEGVVIQLINSALLIGGTKG